MKQIIISKEDNITAESKKLIEEKGIILIECEDPEQIRVVGDLEFYTEDDIFKSAIEVVDYSSFGEKIVNKIMKKFKQ